MPRYVNHEDLRARLRAEYEAGSNMYVLARKYGATPATIRNILLAHNVTFTLTPEMLDHLGLESGVPHFRVANGKRR